MILCSCHRVSDRTLRAEIEAGARTVEELGRRTRAGTECGACRCDLQRLIDAADHRAEVSAPARPAYQRCLEVA